jgi:hypothetical protein
MVSDDTRLALASRLGVCLCLGIALSGCAAFRTFKYEQAVPHGRDIFKASQASRREGKPDSFWKHLPKDNPQLEMKGPAPLSIPVFWTWDPRGGIPDCDFEIIGEVRGETWPGFVFGATIAEPYFRQGAQVAGADAVVYAIPGPLYPGGSEVYMGWLVRKSKPDAAEKR